MILIKEIRQRSQMNYLFEFSPPQMSAPTSLLRSLALVQRMGNECEPGVREIRALRVCQPEGASGEWSGRPLWMVS